MSQENNVKPNYNDANNNHEFNPNNNQYENQMGQTSNLPSNYYDRGYTDSFYYEDEESGAGSFLLGAVIGGVIGAAAALFLAPKTGKEMREDFSSQAIILKDKSFEMSSAAKEKASDFSSVAKDKASDFSSVAKDKATEISSVAKEKATEFTAVAKEKTEGISKSLQEQSGQIVNKVKSMTSKNTVPMDDGTASSEGEEATEFAEKITADIKEKLSDSVEEITSAGEALKEAVEEKETTTK